ncbi:MAG TPA: NUDIX domain-containing protein [Verrucomicrobiae bacterium]|jgi:predicted NUDIX family NTP pyrophosphohydrolase|nr:NUDIX domain-containing protein [Verrucomicrobiae bacterium]
MPKTSAGLLMYRVGNGRLEVLLVHPGGPFWRNKDTGAWSIPKGETEGDEDPLFAAQREFREETGLAPDGDFISLGSVRLKSGKTVHAWAFQGDCDPSLVKSNTISLEWPPKSGKLIEVPEVDQAAFFSVAEARIRINPGQIPFLDQLEKAYGNAA